MNFRDGETAQDDAALRTAYLGIGSNLGDRKLNLKKAIDIIGLCEGVKVESVSKVYETEPWGPVAQDKFLNCVVKILTSLSPHELLSIAKQTEARLKRVTTVRWGPRTLDVDVLIMEGLKVDDEALTIPHPRMWERAFVLVPLSDVEPDMVAPDGGSLTEYVKHLPDLDEVNLFDTGEIWP